jgi:hypothetical protein
MNGSADLLNASTHEGTIFKLTQRYDLLLFLWYGENKNMSGDRTFWTPCISIMREFVQRNAFEFVIDLDKAASSDWGDRKLKNVIVPVSVQDENVCHPVSRRFKHLSLLACASAAGDSFTRFIISTDPISDSVSVNSLRGDQYAIVRPTSAAFDSKDIPGSH